MPDDPGTWRPKADTRGRRSVAAILLLIALDVLSCAAAGTLLLRSDVLPMAMAVHGALMLAAWGCLLPVGGLVARYFKVMPAQNFPEVLEHQFWWNCHRGTQYVGVAVATIALAVILRETGGRFDTLHGRCGLAVMSLAWMQVASPLFRGSKGGPTGRGARADDESTWRGDHYDMTRRRRLFEAWHKPVGWGLLALAGVTLLLGASLAGASDLFVALLGVMAAALVLAMIDSHLRGRWVDTYAAHWGWEKPKLGSTPAPSRVPAE